ncbi:MAG: hypothetical protein DWQ36_05860 [Acidobacteria bacterium]|nr:MAG: hypothetical protein DWQ36_05860 [Acidobacteriota bacterium]
MSSGARRTRSPRRGCRWIGGACTPSLALLLAAVAGGSAHPGPHAALPMGDGRSSGGDFALHSRGAHDAKVESTSGWSLEASALSAENLGEDGWRMLRGATGGGSRSGADCFCGSGLFADGFESGDTSSWSSTVP